MALSRTMRRWLWAGFVANATVAFLLFSAENPLGFLNVAVCAIILFSLREGA